MGTNDTLYTDTKAGEEPKVRTAPVKPIQQRRRFTLEQKRRIVEDALSSGESFAVAARRHNLNANLLFKWRQQYEQGQFDPDTHAAQLLPVTVASPDASAPGSKQSHFSRVGRLEIAMANGNRLTISGSACPDTLRIVLESLGS